MAKLANPPRGRTASFNIAGTSLEGSEEGASSIMTGRARHWVKRRNKHRTDEKDLREKDLLY
jgi:hypothetical protein